MKKLNISNHVSKRNTSFLRYLIPMLIFLLSINGLRAQSQQVLGLFPFMDGGFEGQTPGAAVSTSVAAGATYTNWTASSSSVATLQSTIARTGNKSANFNPTSTTKRLQSPTAPSPAQQAVPATAYTIQYYYRTAGATGTAVTMQAGLSASGTNDGSYTTAVTFAATNGSWVKYSTSFTTKSGTTPSSPVGIIRSSVAIGAAIDVDDFCVYLGSLDVTAPDAATNPGVSSIGAKQMTVSWSAPGTGVDGGGYMVVRSLADPATSPNVNGIYAVGNMVAPGEQVVYVGTNPTFNDTGLSPSTQYFYRIYTVDKAFNYSPALSVNASTIAPVYATEPTSQVSGISFANVTSAGFDINWSAGDGSNSLVVIRAGSSVNANPEDGNSYSANTVFGTGAQIGSGNYVVYGGTGNTVTVTGLTKATNYYVSVFTFNGTGGTENFLLANPATGIQMSLPVEVSSTGTNSAGVSWATASAWSTGVVPGPGDNVTIVSGDKINVASSQSCYNLTIQSGAKLYNNSTLPNISIVYLTVFGSTLTCDGILGDKSENDLTKDGGLGINYNGNLTINGSGTKIRPSRIRPNIGTQNTTLTINADMEMTYTGSNGAGGAAIYTDNGASGNDNITITVNPGKTLSFLSGGNLNTSSSSGSNGTASTTLNINGAVNLPSSANLSLPIASGKTCMVNVNGTLNTFNLNATSAAGGAVPTINVGSAGSITINGTADFSSPTLSATVTGDGSFILGPGAAISVGAPAGLDPVAGPVRTTTRTFDPAANYSFVGAAAQVTGSDLPATVNSLTINNAAGVALSAPTTLTSGITLTGGALNNSTNNITLGNGATVIVTAGSLAAVPVFGTTANLTYNGLLAQTTSNEIPSSAGVLNNLTINNALGLSLGANSTVNGILTFTAGKLSLGANNLTIAPTGSIAGISATSYIVTDGIGKLTQSIGAGATMLFPVGSSTTSYDPATLTPTDATDIAVNVGTTLPDIAPSNYTYNAKVWDISAVSPSSTVVTLTPSTDLSTVLRDVIGHYTGGAYDNVTATKSGNSYSATFTSFSPFVTGTTDLGTSLSQNQLVGVTYDGQIIHNNANVDLQVFDATGRLMVRSNKNINMSGSAKGIYIIKSTSGSLKIAL